MKKLLIIVLGLIVFSCVQAQENKFEVDIEKFSLHIEETISELNSLSFRERKKMNAVARKRAGYYYIDNGVYYLSYGINAKSNVIITHGNRRFEYIFYTKDAVIYDVFLACYYKEGKTFIHPLSIKYMMDKTVKYSPFEEGIDVNKPFQAIDVVN
jgi:hypothetical protein